MHRLAHYSGRFLTKSKPFFNWWVMELRQMAHPLLKHIEEEKTVSVLSIYADRMELRVHNAGDHEDATQAIPVPLEQLNDDQRLALCSQTAASTLLVCLPAQEVHLLTIQHTTATPATYESLTYRLLQEAPIDVKRLVFAWRRSGTAAPDKTNMRFLDVALCRRAFLENTIETVKDIGISPAAIGFGLSNPDQLDYVFPIRDYLDAATSLKTHINKALLAGMVAIPLFAMAGIGIYSHLAARTIQQELALRAAQHGDSDALLRKHAALTAIHAELTRASASPITTNVLNELGRSVPDNTWLSEIRFEGQHLSIVGQSADAAKAAKALSQSPTLSDIRLGSVSSPGAGGTATQFEISATVITKP